jgi:hypothetical protein
MFDLLPHLGIKKRESRVIKLLGLTASNMVLNAFTYSLAGSLFLSRVGSKHLPLAFMLLGFLSIFGYVGFYQIVDRLDRPRLFRYLLLGIIVLTFITRFFINLDYHLTYYIVFIGFYFQWTLLIDILLPSLVSDYCTTLESKRYAHFIGMAQAVGGIVGGGLVGLLSVHLNLENLLLAIPVCAGITIAQLSHLEHSEKPIESRHKEKAKDAYEVAYRKQVNFLKNFPKLVSHYPIVFFFSISVFLFVILRALAEFQYLTIYSLRFPDEQALARFLGWISSISNIVQLILLYYGIQPLLEYLGVSRMNIVYPLTTLLSFLGLGLHFGLPTAVVVNLNNISLEQSLNDSVRNLNYNAIPHQFVGEVRTICDGLFYSVGLIFVGGLLWLSYNHLDSGQITLLGIIFSLLFLISRYFLGKEYLKSLLTLLRSGSIHFDQVSEGLNRLPDQSIAQIRQLLKGDHHDQILGLELASRLKRPQQVLEDIEPLLLAEDLTIHQALVRFFSYNSQVALTRYLGSQLVSDQAVSQLIALAALIAGRQALTDIELRRLLRTTTVRSIKTLTTADRAELDSSELQSHLQINSTIQALVCVAAEVAESRDPEIRSACQKIWDEGLDKAIQLAVIRGIRSAGDHRLIPLLQKILVNATAEVKREGFTTLAELADTGDAALAQLAAQELTNPDPLVRAAVLKLLEVVQRNDLLPQIAQYLEHENLSVRLQSALTLAAYGERSLGLVKPYLLSPRLEVVEAAITALGKLGTRQAENLLFKTLQPEYQNLPKVQFWLRQIPKPAGVWQLLEIAIQDYQNRLTQRVFYTLSSLDHEGTFSYVRQLVSTKDTRARANAIEALASGPHRRFVLPIIPLLEYPEGLEREGIATPKNLPETSTLRLIQETVFFRDRWVQIGALVAAKHLHYLQKKPLEKNPPATSQLPSPDLSMNPNPLQGILENLSDSFVQALAAQLLVTDLNGDYRGELLTDRVLFLKNVALLQHLFLDEILLVLQALELRTFASGECLCKAGTPIDRLYILYKGEISAVTPHQDMIDLSVSQYFGESGLLQDTEFPATFIAKTDCLTLTLTRAAFEPLIDLCPRLLRGFNFWQF